MEGHQQESKLESKEKLSYEIIDIDEGENSDILIKAIMESGGRIDVLMHPFYEDGKENFTYPKELDKLYGESSKTMHAVAEKGIKRALEYYSDKSHVSSPRYRIPIIFQEESYVADLPESLRKRGIVCTQPVFMLKTKDGEGTPIITGSEAETFLKDGKQGPHGEVILLYSLLRNMGVKDIKIMGGYAAIENLWDKDKTPSGEFDFDRCAGTVYRIWKKFYKFCKSEDSSAPVVHLSNFAHPENRGSTKMKIKGGEVSADVLDEI